MPGPCPRMSVNAVNDRDLSILLFLPLHNRFHKKEKEKGHSITQKCAQSWGGVGKGISEEATFPPSFIGLCIQVKGFLKIKHNSIHGAGK